ncbi:hypothetical protein RZA67_13645 [Stenotrophomonas sp. C3(2023)]|nr:hypothetical protein [Stenotrophomonas sp. C3(2023)]
MTDRHHTVIASSGAGADSDRIRTPCDAVACLVGTNARQDADPIGHGRNHRRGFAAQTISRNRFIDAALQRLRRASRHRCAGGQGHGHGHRGGQAGAAFLAARSGKLVSNGPRTRRGIEDQLVNSVHARHPKFSALHAAHRH